MELSRDLLTYLLTKHPKKSKIESFLNCRVAAWLTAYVASICQISDTFTILDSEYLREISSSARVPRTISEKFLNP